VSARGAIVAVLSGEEVVVTKILSKSEDELPVRIQAQHGLKYLLAEGEDALAPDNIIVKKVGKNLHVALDGTDLDAPQLIIEDYYEFEGQLIGMSENGTYHEYVAVHDEHDNFIPFLIDGSSSVQALGVSELEGFSDGLALLSGGVIPTSVLGLGALGLLGGAAAVERQLNNDDSKRHPDEVGVKLIQPSIDLVVDDVGRYKGAMDNGGITDDSTPTFSGKGEPNTTIRFFDAGKLLGSSVIDGSGNWAFTPSNPLQEGWHSITVTSEDGAGNISESSGQFNFVVDTTPPINNGIASIYDEHELIEHGGLTSSNRLVFKGVGEPGDIVTILDNGSVLGEAVVNGQGRWIYTPDQVLLDGSHKVTVVHTDPVGNTSEPSLNYEVVVDTLSPDKPIITSVWDDSGNEVGLLQSGGVTDDVTPLISGVAEAESIVVIYDNGVEIGRVLADVNGQWSFTPNEALVSGFHSVTVKAIDAVGNVSLESESFDLVLLVKSGLPVPTIDSIYDDVGSGVGYLQEDDVTDDAKPTISGTAIAGSTVIVFDNGAVIGQVLVGQSEAWSFEPSVPLLNGKHALSVMTVDNDGGHSQLSPDFTISVRVGGVPTAPAINTVIDDVGVYQGALQKDDITDDARPTIEGTARPGYIVTIYDNGHPIGITKSDDHGFWRFTPAGDLEDGAHKFTVTSRNGDGEESSKSGVFTIEIDTQAPHSPSNISVIDNDHEQQSVELNGMTSDSTPKIVGTSEPYNFIQIKDGDLVLGTALADSAGIWEFVPTKSLSNGLHSITAAAMDDAGNISEPSPAFSFTVHIPLFKAVVLNAGEDFEVASSNEVALTDLSISDVLSSEDPEFFSNVSISVLNAEVGIPLEIELDNSAFSVTEVMGSPEYFHSSSDFILLDGSVDL
jgi:hypothetical protein